MTDAVDSPWRPWSPPRHLVSTLEGPDGALDLMLYQPEGEAPAGGWPCLVVLDGERYFAAAAGAAASLSRRSAKTGVTPMVVAAIAHRTDAGAIEDQRARDFTRHPCSESDWSRPAGGGAAFYRRLVDQALPRIARTTPIDPRRMALFGHSLAGLFVLETLETAPETFARWISISPSLWWRTPDPDIASPSLLIGCGEAETRRDMRGRIEGWAAFKHRQGASFHLAPGADHGSTPFALLPDVLRHASSV